MNLKRIARVLGSQKDLIVSEVVLDTATKEGQIVHGARAFNLQSPTYLRKRTIDYDILTKKPKKYAQEVAKQLSRRLGKEVKVVKGSHKETYRVKVNGEVVTDYTQLKYKPKTKKVWGTQVKDIKSIKRSVQRLIKKKESEFRREKDISTLDRIQEIERLDEAFNF